MILQGITLSADRRITPPVLYAVQNDTGREILARFMDYEIPAGATATLHGELPDGSGADSDAEIAGQTVTADPTDLLTEAGTVKAQIEIDDGETVTSFAFLIIVQEDITGGAT